MTPPPSGDLPGRVIVRDLGAMKPVHLSVCRDCLTDPDPGCWKCRGGVVVGCEPGAADLVLRFTVTPPMQVSYTLEATDRLRQWVEEVAG